MIISFETTTQHPRTNDITYWFTVKIPTYEYTCIDVGFSQSGEWTAASGSFYNLSADLRKEIIDVIKEMFPKVV